MGLCGTAKTHCCWFSGEECEYVGPSSVGGWRWACSLYEKYGNWPAVHASDEYQSNVKNKMLAAGYEIDCGSWPPPGVKCNDCGEVG